MLCSSNKKKHLIQFYKNNIQCANLRLETIVYYGKREVIP